MAEVAARGVREEADVLRRERAVETEFAPERRDVGGRGPLAEHDLHRVAGQEVEEGEHEGHDPEHGGQEEHQAPDGERRHQSSHAEARPRRSPLGEGSNPCSRRGCTTTRSSHQSGTTGRSWARRRCTRA